MDYRDKQYTDEEIEELILSGEAEVADRRFSTYESNKDIEIVTETREFSGANLNIRSVIQYMQLDLESQFRVLYMTVKRYTKTLNPKTDSSRIEATYDYVSSELARIIVAAKTKMGKEGGTLNSILKLSRIGGGKVTQVANQLSRFLLRADNAMKRSGIVPKNITENITELYRVLVKEIISKMGLTELMPTSSDKVPMDKSSNSTEESIEDGVYRTVHMSDTSDLDENDDEIISEEVTREFVIEGMDVGQIDEVEEFIDSLDIGIYNIEYDNGLMKVTFHDEIDNNKLITFKKFINGK